MRRLYRTEQTLIILVDITCILCYITYDIELADVSGDFKKDGHHCSESKGMIQLSMVPVLFFFILIFLPVSTFLPISTEHTIPPLVP